MLFVIVAEALNTLLERAKQARLLTGFTIANSVHEVTHLQLADDTIIFCDASSDQLDNLKFLLQWFEMLSGLKFNYDKCELIGVRIVESHVSVSPV